DRLDLLVLVKLRHVLREDQVAPHAALGKLFDALDVLGAVSVGVKVQRPGVTAVFQHLDQEERLLDVFRSKTQVLVEAADLLIVEVDVEELAHLKGLGDDVMERKARHGLVGKLGVGAYHIGVIERRDEGEVRTRGREENVAPRLVGLGLQGKLHVVTFVDDVFAQVVDGLAGALDSFHRVFRGVDLRALAPAPKDEDLAAQLSRKIDGLDGLAERVAAHFGNVAGKGAVLEDRVKKEVGRPHHKREAGLLERLFKTGDDLVSFGRRGVDGHQVVVVEVDTPSADVSEHMHDVDGINGRAHFKAKGIASAVANSPKPKRETIRR